MNTVKGFSALLSLFCLGVAVLLAHRTPVNPSSHSGKLEAVSTILWSSDSTSFYPNKNQLHEVEKGALLGWNLDSSQYHAAHSLLQYVLIGKVDAATLEFLGISLGMENPLSLFALKDMDKKQRRPNSQQGTIPSIDEIRTYEFALDSLRRVWNQSGPKSGQEEVLLAIQSTESHLNNLKKRRDQAILESDQPFSEPEITVHKWNFRLMKSLADSLLEQHQVFALDLGVFKSVQHIDGTVSFCLVQYDPKWVKFIPEHANGLATQLKENQFNLSSPDHKTLFPVSEVKKQDKGWLLKLPDASVNPEFMEGWVLLDRNENTLLQRWISWRSN